ncbi:MAG: LysR substrate-binding domain-containing protein [Myxococcota bacterium]|jgi:LysR family transcriptional regulator, regulator for bpeEF and oprC|nr:LysR substrate-binding domain-containing protein [Myxococcota bacterium]
MSYQSDEALEELRAFVAVVDAQGFRAAARVTRGRKATLSKRVQDLEARLGVPLLVRTTRSMRLTDEGRAYFEHAARALEAARDAESAVLSAQAAPRGVLRVTTAAALSAHILDAVIARYLQKYPDVRLVLHASERRLDIVREGFDVAIWGGPLEDSSLVARKLGVAGGGYFASPRYLARRPEPKSPEDLAAHDLVTITKDAGATEWPFVAGGRDKRVAIRPRLVVNDLELALRAGLAAMGIVPAPLALAAPHVAKKQLIQLLRQWTRPSIDVHAVFPPGGALVPKTRAFLDLLSEGFGRPARRRSLSQR